MANDKITISDLKRKKERGEKITMLTASDYPMALLVDRAGVDAVLVGDSLGMVALGYDSTAEVTMDDMVHHARAARRAVKRAILIGDMPYMSYQSSDDDARRNASRFVKEAGCDMVKLEGGEDITYRIRAIVGVGIPVIGHVGLTPQTAAEKGGYKVQGKDAEAAEKIIVDAKAVESAGASAVVIECVPKDLARKITESLSIPTIGIGAGVFCDGQVLVTHDIVGYFDKFLPKFAKRYVNISVEMQKAVSEFKNEVESGKFPDDAHSF